MAARVSKIFDSSLSSSPSSIPPHNTAVLLLDYQNFIVSGLEEAGIETVRVAREIRDWAVTKNVFVVHGVVDVYGQPSTCSRMRERWVKYEDRFRQNPGLGEEVKELQRICLPLDGDADRLNDSQASAQNTAHSLEHCFKRKPGTVSAIESPGLSHALEERRIRSLIICGLSTSGCVLSTVRSATDQSFVVTVVEDACYDPVPGLHDMLVRYVLPTTAHVARSSEIRNIWGDTV